MTTTDTAGVAGVLTARLEAVHRPITHAARDAGMITSTLYRRLREPSEWRLGELEAAARAAGLVLRLELTPAPGSPRAMTPAVLDETTDEGQA